MSAYRIRAVSELAGVTTATLRAWERRYGVPSPARTASAYRLYGDADVKLVRKMRELVDGGVAPAEAARQVLAESAPAPPPQEVIDPYEAAADRIVAATTSFDPDAVALEVSRALALGPAVTIFDRTLAPALHRIGDLWHRGTITVAQEHLAAHIVMSSLADMIRFAQPLGESRRVILACFADEDHQIPLHGAGLHLTSWGFRVVMIGARTPPAAIARAVATLAPDLVALSVTMAPPPARARELVDAYADACRGATWLVGGQASEGMRAWIEARGGIVAASLSPDLQRRIDRAIAAKKRDKS